MQRCSRGVAPCRPESLWDWDLAKAAVAAQQAIGDLRDLDDDEDRSKFSAALPSQASGNLLQAHADLIGKVYA